MSSLTVNQIDSIAKKILEQLSLGKDPGSLGAMASGGSLTEGVFSDMDRATEAVRSAQREFIQIPLSRREAIIANIRKTMLDNVRTLSEMANSETGLGRVEDKIIKNRLVSEKTPGTEDLQPWARSGDRGLSLFELAPFGVIGAVTPITNPTSTIICNTIGMIAAGNGVVFNPHPGAKNCCLTTISLINKAVISAGGPANLIASVAEPTIESAQQMFNHPSVRLIVVTGGEGVVKAAQQSGKRAICAGPGNPPSVVDETADIAKAAKDIVMGASFDNNIICTDEKSTFAVDSIADDLTRAMGQSSAVVLNKSQAMALERTIFKKIYGPRQGGTVDKSLIGKNASFILSKIGINVEDKVRLAVVEVDKEHPLVFTEQMMPVMPVVRVTSADEGIEWAKMSEKGYRHTASMHSKNITNLHNMARAMDCSIFVKNGPNYAGLGEGGEGYTSFSIASPTGEGLTRPRTFSRERRCVIVDHFRIV